MRLWHQDLVEHLSQQRILGQHRECCALRGKGWNKDHETVDYVFEHPMSSLVSYHWYVMHIGSNQHDINFNTAWWDEPYRGREIGIDTDMIGASDSGRVQGLFRRATEYGYTIYPEHDEPYLQECIENLQEKGVDISEEVVTCQ